MPPYHQDHLLVALSCHPAKGRSLPVSFEKEHYQKVVSALKDEDAIINVSGMIRTDRAKRKIEWLRVEKIEETAPFKDTDIDAFLGCAPNITGDMTTDQFIDSIRDNGD